MPSKPAPPAADGEERWFTKKQAATLAGHDEKTVQRALPTPDNAALGRVRLPNARRDGDGPNAPWLIPGSDLLAAGWCSAEDLPGSGGSSVGQALDRQRDDRELARLREENAAFRGADQLKTALLDDRRTEIDRLRKQNDRLLEIVATALRSVA